MNEREEESKKVINMNKKYIFVASIVLVVSVITGIMLLPDTTYLCILEDSITIEYGESISYNVEDYLDLSAIDDKETFLSEVILEILDHDDEVYPVREYTLQFAYQKELLSMTVIVKDTIAPVFETIDTDFLTIEILKEEKIEESFLESFVATDLSEFDLLLDDSQVDYSVVGQYDAYVKATDIHGNENKVKIVVEVVEGVIQVESESIELTIGNTYSLNPTFSGNDDTQSFEFTSEDKSIATVNQNGMVTAIKKGTTTISIVIEDVSKEVKVTVKENSSSSSSTDNSSSNSSSSNSTNNSANNESSNESQEEWEEFDEFFWTEKTGKLSTDAITLINEERAKLGLSALTYSSYLGDIALKRAVEIQTDFTHDGMDKYDPNYTIGECCASVGASNSYASYVVSGWMNSTGHRNTLMDVSKEHTEIAVAYTTGYWVVLVR